MLIPKPIPFLLSAILILLGGNTQAQLLPIVDHQGGNASSIQTYIIHVQRPDHADHLSSQDLEKWYLSFLPHTTRDSGEAGEPMLVYSYRHVISGFAARLNPEELMAMEAMDGFVSAQPDRHNPLLTTYTPNFLELNSWNSLWHSSGYGQGVIIGVVDSGIVPNHTSFADDGMAQPPLKWGGCCEFNVGNCNSPVPSICNNKLIGAMSFHWGSSALDKIGHGTHCASIAAGNRVTGAEVLGQAKGTAMGMAPRAHLASYKVCEKVGTGHTCRDSDTLAGIDRAIYDQVDVLSLSLGATKEHFYESNQAKATFAAMEKGIIASSCAGNEGRYRNALQNDAPWILTVGASSIDRSARAIVRLGNGMELIGESAYQPEQGEFIPTMMPIAFPGTTQKDPQLACRKNSLNGIDVTGKIVLCAYDLGRGIEKSEEVKAAGGAGVVVMNNNWDGFTTWSDPHVLPAAHLNHVDSLKIIAYFNTATDPTAMIIFEGTKFGARKSPAVAAFSSRGPSLRNGGILKPDIIGPGVNILAAWHKEVGPNPTGSTTSPFKFASGCSMATPHLAGIAALLKSSHPDWSPAAIKSAIMTTAHIRDRNGDPITDEKSIHQGPASLFAMGAGHVNPPKADDPGLVYDTQQEDYIGYLCGLGYTDTQVFRVVSRPIQCSNVKKIDAEDLNYPSILVSLESKKMKTVPRTLTNVAPVGEEEEVYLAQVDEPEGTEVKVEPDMLKFSKLEQEKSFQVKIKAKDNATPRGDYSEGYLTWVSDKHVVRSPIAVKY